MDEQWRKIPDCDGLYEVSNTGKVRSFRNGKMWKMLKGSDNGLGYRKVQIRKNDGTKKCEYIHRLVASAFIPNCNHKPCVNHIDNNPQNNHANNLEWCTKQENTDWMSAQGRNKRTERWLNKLHEAQRRSYKAVVGVNSTTGEIVRFDHLNGVRTKGFFPGNVCTSCKTGKPYRGYEWHYAEDSGI